MSERRGSIGDIAVGDTQGSAIGTSPAGELRSRNRKKSLSQANITPQKPAAPSSSGPKGPSTSTLKIKEFLWKRSWFAPLVVCLTVYAAWYVVGGSWLDACVRISYFDPATSLYGKGLRDITFVLFYSIVFTFAREFIMQTILKPIAYRCKLKTNHKVNRFLEQAYSIIYYAVAGPAGLWLMYNSDMWYFNTTAFYADYPHKQDTLGFKLFYLLQAAFWTQQALVLVFNLEKKRKDFQELVFHHIVTLALITLSYRFHFTHIGLAIYITMDISDLFLAISKTMNYLDHFLTVPLFVIFIGVWAYLRHWVNLRILWSVITEFRTVGPYELNWETGQYKCLLAQVITFSLLMALQLVNAYWFVLIIRILVRYITENEASDMRSEDEDEEKEKEE